MKSLLFTIAFTLSGLFLVAQEQTITEKLKGDQVGIGFNGNNFTLMYKQKKDNGYLLYDGLFASAGSSNFSNFNLNAGLTLYKLKDQDISQKFFISRGWGAGIRTQLNTNSNNAILAVSPSLAYRAEFNYRLNNNMYIGASISPALSLNTTINTQNSDFNYNIGLNVSNAARLQFYYSF